MLDNNLVAPSDSTRWPPRKVYHPRATPTTKHIQPWSPSKGIVFSRWTISPERADDTETLNGCLRFTKGTVHLYSYPRDRFLRMGREHGFDNDLIATFRISSNNSFHVQKYVTRLALKMHSTFEIPSSNHRDAVCSRFSMDASLVWILLSLFVVNKSL
jgi:hypothetical protein